VASLLFELGILLSAGLPIDRALDFAGNRAYGRGLQTAVTLIRNEVREGAALSQALERRGNAFPRECASVIRAGETSGNLTSALEALARDLNRRIAFKQKLTSALVYPAIVLGLVVAILIFVLTVVLPQVEIMLKDFGGALPVSTMVLIHIGDFMQTYWWLLVLAMAVAIFSTPRLLARADVRRAVDAWLLRSPIMLNLPRRIAVARVCGLLSLQIENGVGLAQALDIVRAAVTNVHLRNALSDAHAAVRHGSSLSTRLTKLKVFPSLIVRLIAVGEESGKLGRLLAVAADIYQSEIERDLERLIAILVPALTILLGLIVATVVGSVLVGILSVNQAAF
jgi:general secretion pathway protein F